MRDTVLAHLAGAVSCCGKGSKEYKALVRVQRTIEEQYGKLFEDLRMPEKEWVE